MYNVKSKKAEEFISHEEVLDTLKYADENKTNTALIDEILKINIEKTVFSPTVDTDVRQNLLNGWKKAVTASQSFVGE